MSIDHRQEKQVTSLPSAVVVPAATTKALLLSTYRPALFLAFFACFMWWVLVSNGVFDKLAFVLPPEVNFLLGLFIPTGTAVAVLYPTAFLRNRGPALRMFMLFLTSCGLLLAAFMPLLAVSLFLFAIGAISPN